MTIRTQTLIQHRDKIDDLFDKLQLVSGGDLEIQSHWAKYLCVQVSGFLENAVAEVYSHYCLVRANQTVTNFTRKQLRRVQNPNTNKFLELAGAFEKDWRKALEEYVNEEGRAEALNSIIANRHLIVHGKNSGISFVQIKEYYKKALQVVEYIENQCDL